MARTAGRYVRAAGIAFKKERERLAAESERKRAAEAAQAAQVAAQQPPQAPPQAVAPPPAAAAPQAAAPPPAGTKPAKAPRPIPPAPPPNKFLDRILWLGFIVTIVATCLVLLSIDSVMPAGTPKTVFRLVIGGICFLYAGILLTNWNHAKERVLAMMTKKLWGLEHPRTRTGRFMRAVAKDVLTLLAIGWLAVGVLDLLRVVVD